MFFYEDSDSRKYESKVLFCNFSVSIVVDQSENPTDEGVLSAEQSQSPSELFVVHGFLIVAKLVESLGDDSKLIF